LKFIQAIHRPLEQPLYGQSSTVNHSRINSIIAAERDADLLKESVTFPLVGAVSKKDLPTFRFE